MSDLISKDEAVALVNRAIRGIGDKDAQEYLFDGLRKQMWALPSAEPKTGKWIKVIDEETPNVVKWHYECDQCGAGRFEKGQQYCSRCGARMNGSEEE